MEKHARSQTQKFPAAQLLYWRFAVGNELQSGTEGRTQGTAEAGGDALQCEDTLVQGVLKIDGVEGSQARQQTGFGCRETALGCGCKGGRRDLECRAVVAVTLRRCWGRGGVPASSSPASATSAANCGSGMLCGRSEVLLDPVVAACGVGMCG